MTRITAMIRLALILNFPLGVLYAQAPIPQFKDYPSKSVYKGRNAPLVLRLEDRTYRTRLRAAASLKPNFAGHYILTAWGCGAECLMGAVIDAKSGSVYWLPHTICCWGTEVDDPIEHRLDSRLIIFSGQRNEAGDDGIHFYEFDNGKFVKLE